MYTQTQRNRRRQLNFRRIISAQHQRNENTTSKLWQNVCVLRVKCVERWDLMRWHVYAPHLVKRSAPFAQHNPPHCNASVMFGYVRLTRDYARLSQFPSNSKAYVSLSLFPRGPTFWVNWDLIRSTETFSGRHPRDRVKVQKCGIQGIWF